MTASRRCATVATLCFVASGLSGCGVPADLAASDSTEAHPLPHVLVPFQDWCDSWSLKCPNGVAPDVPFVPDDGTPWTAVRWRAATSIFGAVVRSPSDIRLSATDLDDPILDQVVAALGGSDSLVEWRQRLKVAGVDGAAFGAGSLRVASPTAGVVATDSGLRVHHAALVEVREEAEGKLTVAGLGLSSALSIDKPASVDGVAVSAPNLVEWRSSSDYRYVDVSLAFLAKELVGVDLTKVPERKNGGLAPWLAVATPLKNWLTKGTRDLTLDAVTLSALLDHVPALIDEPTAAAAVSYILSRLTRVESTAATRASKLVSGTAKTEIQCRVNGEALLFIAPTFALRSLEPLSGGGVRLKLDGWRAKPLKGLVRPTVSLSTVDVTATAVTIRDLPVIGSYTIDLTAPDNDELSLVCGAG